MNVVSHVPPVSPAPLTAEYETTLQLAEPNTSAKRFESKLFRSGDGKMRVDYGEISAIVDPIAQQTITLDHLRKEARIFRMPKAPPQLGPGELQVPSLAADSSPPSLPSAVEDLGTSIIDGHEAEGKRYTFQPPQIREPPDLGQALAPRRAQLPKLPDLPKLQEQPRPGAGAPQALLPIQSKIPHTVEVWTSAKLHLPVLNKMTGSFGQHTGSFKNAAFGEPPASLFQIPPHYKLVKMPPGVPLV